MACRRRYLIDQWSVSRILPLRHQVGPVAIVPGKMIGGEIDEDEHWTARMFCARSCASQPHKRNCRVRSGACRDLLGEEMLDAGRGLEAARAHEGAQRGIKRKRTIATASQCGGQPAPNAAGRYPCHEIGEAAERARGETRRERCTLCTSSGRRHFRRGSGVPCRRKTRNASRSHSAA